MDSMGENSTALDDNITCTDFSQPIFIAVGALRSTSSFISVLASVFVISLIVLFKKYVFFVQRLILYLSITVMLNGLSRTVVISYLHPGNQNTDNACIAIGFLDQLTVWMYQVATLVIMFYIYTKTVHVKDLKWEKFYLVATFVFPFFFAWIPFIKLTYGPAGPWCWIRRTNDDCTDNELGIIHRYVLFYGPSYLILAIILGMLIVMKVVIYKKKDKLIINVNRPDAIKQYEMLVNETKNLVWYPVILIIVQLPGVVNRATEELYSGTVYPLWFIHAIIFPLQGAFICIAYALDPDTRQALKKCSPRSIVNSCMKKSANKPEEYPVSIGFSDSLSYRFKAMITHNRNENRNENKNENKNEIKKDTEAV